MSSIRDKPLIFAVSTPFAEKVVRFNDGTQVRRITLETDTSTEQDEISFRLLGIKGRLVDGMSMPITFFFRNGLTKTVMFEVEGDAEYFETDDDEYDEPVTDRRKPNKFWQWIFSND